MTQISRLPQDDKTNGWSAILERRQPKPELDRQIDADWVVVGAGYAGLAAARRLAENRPGDRIVLVEAHEVGENASGRNSGFGIDLPHIVGSAHDELDGSYRFMRLARTAIDHLETAVHRHAIVCDWSRAGKFHAAVSTAGAKTLLEPFSRELEALKEPMTWVDRDALAARLGTAHFAAAVYTPGCVLMNPAALTRGLADTLPANVVLHEQSPVIEADYGRDAVTLKTPRGQIRAARMILAVNGYAPAFGFFAGRLLPFAAHASLTRPLNDDEHASLGGIAEWGLTPANAFAAITMRYTSDRRILIRQNIHYCPSMRQSEERRQRIARHHLKLFRARFPRLPKVGIEHTWTGYVCFSRNGAPGFGELAPNIWSTVCCNAVGVTKATIAGLLAADLATKRDNPLIADMEALGKPSALPPRPFLDLGVEARMAWEFWQARAER